ncbi:unnamed protein product [Effrenium voratum]|uniref:Uncharacterized protein n=1 Tax=Effrenium voratum TaxID=2562239 RepID=A0AA36MRY0_9DINO|nr:unnamed protein product [Effrenium voratum]
MCEELRALAKDKLLAVLPAVSFQALLDYAVPGEMGRELEEYGEVTLAMLLEAAPADVRAEFKHLGSCVLGDLAAAQGLAGNKEELRALVKDKLLALLPAVSLQALLDYAVPGEMGRELEEYGEVLVAAQEVTLAMLLEAAPADVHAEFEHLGSCVLGDLAAAQAGALLEGLSSDRQGLWTACENAGISRKQGGRSLQQEELRALEKDKLLAVLPAVSFQALLDYAVPGEMGRELEEYGEVLLMAAQEVARLTELLRALGAGADELRKASSVWGIEIRNASGRPRTAQSVRSELRGACVRFLKETPVSDALGDAEQGVTASAVARAAADVKVPARWWSNACRLPLGTLAEAVVWLQQNRVVPRKTRGVAGAAGSLKDVQQRKCTPFAQDFRHVHIPHHWDGQQVLRRLAGMELEHAVVVARRIELPLLDGPLVVEVMRARCQTDAKRCVGSVHTLVNALESARNSMPDQAAWFESAWGVKEREHLATLVNDFDTFLSVHALRELWATASLGTLMVWVGWFGILQHREHRKPRVQEVVTECRGLLKAPATYILSERVDTCASPPSFKREAAMAGFGACRTLPEELLPVLTAPRPCQLCGDGFVEWSDLDTKHINWAEYRKRVFWHAQYEAADPCDAQRVWRRCEQIAMNST